MQIQILIDNVDRTSIIDRSSFRKTDNINNIVDTLNFRIAKSAEVDFEPVVNSEVVVRDLDTNTILFGGHISEVGRSIEGLLLTYSITCIDYTGELDRALVFERFEEMSVQEIIVFIINKYAPNFTTNNVDAGDFLEEASALETFQIGDGGVLVKYVTEGPYYWSPAESGTEGRWNWSFWGTSGS